MTMEERITNMQSDMVGFQKRLTAIPAIAPDSGGQGEWKKAEELIRFLQEQGFESIENFPAPDDRVPEGKRPNIVLTYPGESSDVLWIMSHLDVVPPGDATKWDSDPYTVVERDGKIYGRGVEDNQQGLTASLFALIALKNAGITPKRTIKLLFVADEEVGSQYGIQYLVKETKLFSKNDWVIAPDGGQADGSVIEVAEKSVLWLKFTTTGKECHASTPNQGSNAFLAASDLVVHLHRLHDMFPQRDKLFDVPYSSFVPSKKEANVPNINTVPGEDVFYMDCRILPSINVDDVLEKVERFIQVIEEDYAVKITYDIVERQESAPTAADCELVKRLAAAIESVLPVKTRTIGIGGGTVASYLRNEGIDTLVWATMDETMHRPNEYCVLKNLVNDAVIFAKLMQG